MHGVNRTWIQGSIRAVYDGLKKEQVVLISWLFNDISNELVHLLVKHFMSGIVKRVENGGGHDVEKSKCNRGRDLSMLRTLTYHISYTTDQSGSIPTRIIEWIL